MTASIEEVLDSQESTTDFIYAIHTLASRVANSNALPRSSASVARAPRGNAEPPQPQRVFHTLGGAAG